MWSCADCAATKVTLNKGVSFGGRGSVTRMWPVPNRNGGHLLQFTQSFALRVSPLGRVFARDRVSPPAVRQLARDTLFMAFGGGPDGGLDVADHLNSSPAMRNDPIGCFEALFGQRLQGQQLSFGKDGRERITDVVKSLQCYLAGRD